MYIYIVVLVT